MSVAAKQLRLSRFLDPRSRRGIIVPIDHGLTMGPIDGLQNAARIGSWLSSPGINGVIAHKGMAERLAARGLLGGIGLMVHVNGMHAMAPNPDQKELLTSVKTVVRLGADALSLQLNFDGQNDAHNLRLLGGVVDEAMEYGLPVLTMLYDKKVDVAAEDRVPRLRHLMRLCIELGTDALKIAPPQQLADVGPILEFLSEDALVFFAGGSLGEAGTDASLVALAREGARHGAAGFCVGRNVFQREDPRAILGELSAALSAPRSVPIKPAALSRKGAQLGVH
jgi:class I fructose-bisphosphate aldolase